MAWILFAVLLVGAAGVLLVSSIQRQQRQHSVEQRLVDSPTYSKREALDEHLQHVGQTAWARRLVSIDQETASLLQQAGWVKASHRALFAVAQIGLPLVLLGLALLFVKTRAEPVAHAWTWYFFAVAVGVLAPKRILAKAVAKRKQALASEVSIFIPLLRILFGAGLTVEQSIRVLCADSETLMPVLSAEVKTLLIRVDSGMSMPDEMQMLSQRLDVAEFTDCIAILRQLTTQGGSAMQSLLTLKKLLDDRRLTSLQEKVSKMSAKMSAVMMLFLFPALLIVLAAPGFIAIGKGLGGMS